MAIQEQSNTIAPDLNPADGEKITLLAEAKQENTELHVALDAANRLAREWESSSPERREEIRTLMVAAWKNFGNEISKFNQYKGDKQAETMNAYGALIGGVSFEGTHRDARIAAMSTKITDGLQDGTLNPNDASLILALGIIDLHTADAQKEGISSTSGGMVRRDIAPENAVKKG